MSENDNGGGEKVVVGEEENVVVVVETPYLNEAGLHLDFEELKRANNFDNQTCLAEGTIFNNGIMGELIKYLKIARSLFFELVKSIVPHSVYNELAAVDMKTFMGKLQTFEKQYKSKRKTKKTFSVYLAEEYAFLPKQRTRESPCKRALKQTVVTLKKSKKELEDTCYKKERDGIEKGYRIANLLAGQAEKDAEIETTRNDLVKSVEKVEEIEMLLSLQEGKAAEIEAAKEKLKEMEESRMKLNQKIKGMKSGIACSRKISEAGTSRQQPCGSKTNKKCDNS